MYEEKIVIWAASWRGFNLSSVGPVALVLWRAYHRRSTTEKESKTIDFRARGMQKRKMKSLATQYHFQRHVAKDRPPF